MATTKKQADEKAQAVPVRANEKPAAKGSGTTPFATLRDVERLFDNFVERSWLKPFRAEWPQWPDTSKLVPHTPPVDVVDHEKEVVVRAQLPGFKKNDLDVSIAERTLTIKGSTREEQKEEKDNYFHQEIRTGSFSRSVLLPADVDAGKAQATFKDGVLELDAAEAPRRQTTAGAGALSGHETAFDREQMDGRVRNRQSNFVTAACLQGWRRTFLGFLAAHARVRRLEENEVLFHYGEIAERFYLVAKGHVSVEVAAIEGPSLQLQDLGPGTVLGWSWLIPPRRWSFQARAKMPAEIIEFDGDAVLAECESNPKFGYALLKRFSALMSERLQYARQRMIEEWRPEGFA